MWNKVFFCWLPQSVQNQYIVHVTVYAIKNKQFMYFVICSTFIRWYIEFFYIYVNFLFLFNVPLQYLFDLSIPFYLIKRVKKKIASLPLCSVLAFHDESKMSPFFLKITCLHKSTKQITLVFFTCSVFRTMHEWCTYVS